MFTVGLQCPKAFTDALVQVAKLEGLDFNDVFARAVAMKLKEHGGVAGIQQTFGGGRPVP